MGYRSLSSWMACRTEWVGPSSFQFYIKRILLEENKSLQKEVGRLQNELTILTEQIRELEMKFTAGAIEKQIPFDVVPSLVIGRDPYDWFGKLIIDKGTNDEIIPDLTVVTYQGLVGRVEQTYPNYSIVRLILSSEIATCNPSKDQAFRSSGREWKRAMRYALCLSSFPGSSWRFGNNIWFRD